MAEHDDIEARLREFRPRRPAVIPDQRLQLLRGPVWVAVAAGLATAMFIASRVRTPDRQALPATLGALTAIAVERPDDLDAALVRMSHETLPDVTQPGGVLEPLAKF